MAIFKAMKLFTKENYLQINILQMTNFVKRLKSSSY